MKNIETTIVINAPISSVWKTLMDFNHYPTWNPLILTLSGEAKRHNHLKAHIQPPGQNGMDFQPKILVVNPNNEFRWKGKLFIPGLFDGEHYFQLKEINGTTLFTHGEIFSGLLTGLIFSKIGEATRKGFEMMNEALKTTSRIKFIDMKLKTILQLNAFYSSICGLLAVIYSSALSDFFQWSDTWPINAIGISLIGFGVFVLFSSTTIRNNFIQLIIGADFSWVFTTLILVVWQPEFATDTFLLTLSGLSIVVLTLAVLQVIGLKQLSLQHDKTGKTNLGL